MPRLIPRTDIDVNVLRIPETIHGRPCVIEVRPVGPQRWRAQLSRRDGTTALMPFYGSTPDEAAQLLTRWLERAGGASPSVRPSVEAS